MPANPDVSVCTLQGWLGYSDPATTAIYARFAPSAQEADWVEEAFSSAVIPSTLRTMSADRPSPQS